jgi:heme exporter protein C
VKGRLIYTIFTAALIFFAGYAGLFIAPDEKTMHAVQRIFYFHVGSWNAMFSALFVVFFANVAYLLTRRQKYDALGVSGAEIGVMCCTIGLITGPLWAKPVWGIYWTWDARLTSTFILWLLYIAYLLLRGLLEDPQKKASLSAIFGIFAFLDVPMVYLSNRLWRTQHPQPVILGGSDSGLAPMIAKVLVLCIFAMFFLMVLVFIDRYQLEKLRNECEELRYEIESRSAQAQSLPQPASQRMNG